MTVGNGPTLAEQRQGLRGQIQTQRQRLEEQLAPAANLRGRYPRSATMRVLIQRPGLVTGLTALVAGARFAGSVSAVLMLVRALSPTVAVTAQQPLAAPQRG